MRNVKDSARDDANKLHTHLQSEFEELIKGLVGVNENAALKGERADLIEEIQSLWARIGVPGQREIGELRDVERKLGEFRREREKDRKATLDAWGELEREYKAERNRLAGSTELSDQKAMEYLDATHQRAVSRMKAVKEFLRWEDVSSLALDITQERHMVHGWDAALVATLQEAPGENSNAWANWPPLSFKTEQLLLETTADSAEKLQHMRVTLRHNLDSAIRYQVRQMAKTMFQEGVPVAEVTDWARRTRSYARIQADKLVNKMPMTSPTAQKWTGRLHIAGKITVAVDIGVTVIQVIAASPKDRPRLILVQGSRILGGYMGAKVGGSLGMSWGMKYFGPKGAFIGGLAGGLLGGFGGAWMAKTAGKFIANDIWPPESTYIEFISR